MKNNGKEDACLVEKNILTTDEEICNACEKYRLKREERMAEEAKMWFFEITYFLVIFGTLALLAMCTR